MYQEKSIKFNLQIFIQDRHVLCLNFIIKKIERLVAPLGYGALSMCLLNCNFEPALHIINSEKKNYK